MKERNKSRLWRLPNAKKDGKRFKKYKNGAPSKPKTEKAKSLRSRVKLASKPCKNLRTSTRKTIHKSLKVSRSASTNANFSSKRRL